MSLDRFLDFIFENPIKFDPPDYLLFFLYLF